MEKKKVKQRTQTTPSLYTEITLNFTQSHQYPSQADSQKCVLPENTIV